MFRMYAGIAVALFIGLAVWAGYTFYTDTQDRIQTLTEQNTRLEVALRQEQETIRKIREFQKTQALLDEALNKSLADAEAPVREIQRLFSDNNFKQLALEKPALIEERINIATDSLFKAIECDTGNCSE